MNERWITIGEVAQREGISRPTARKYLEDGSIPGAVMHFGFLRVERKAYETWADSKDLGKTDKVDKLTKGRSVN